MQTDAERIATLEQVARDLRDNLEDVRRMQREDHHRLRAVEAAVALLVDSSNDARQTLAVRQRSLEVRLQVLTVIVAVAALGIPVIYALIHH